MPPAVRLSDKAVCPSDAHGCPACPHPTVGPAVNGSTNVFINKRAAIRLGDAGIHAACCGPNQWKVAKGSPSVYVNGKPLARMGDKTSHCGGSGTLVQGSPNVFADDGASGAGGSALSRLKELAARMAQDGRWNADELNENGDWEDGKGGGGSGGKAGKGGAGAGGAGAGGEGQSAEGGQTRGDTGGILKVKWDKPKVSPGEKAPFTVELAADAKGVVAIDVIDRADGKVVTSTSVTANSPGAVLTGSVVAPEVDAEARPPARKLDIKAVLDGKGDGLTGSEPCAVSLGGIMLRLFDEQHGEGDPEPENTEPTRRRPRTTVKVGGVVEVARVRIVAEGQTLEFTDVKFEDGVCWVRPPQGRKIGRPQKPAKGEPYDTSVVKIEFKDPKFKDFKVRAFDPTE